MIVCPLCWEEVTIIVKENILQLQLAITIALDRTALVVAGKLVIIAIIIQVVFGNIIINFQFTEKMHLLCKFSIRKDGNKTLV